MDLDIRPLTGETWPALSALFEEGGDPKWCWCQFWRSTGFSGTAKEVSAHSRELLSAQARGPLAPGLVALDPDGRAVGWVSVGPRDDYEHLVRSRVRPRLDDLPVWAILCFVVSRRARGQGVAGQLLAGAVQFAREHGAPAIEAYPVDTGQGKPTPATLYTGTLSTFERAGFRVMRPVESRQATVVRDIVRRDLQ